MKNRKSYSISFGLVLKWFLSAWHELTLLDIISEHYTIEPLVALGLKPDSSKNHQQINFSCLLARKYIWMSKRKQTAPTIEGFLQYLKSIYDIEANAETALPKKWELLIWTYSSKPCFFEPSVFLDPLYILSVFDFGYICSAIHCLLRKWKHKISLFI